MGLLFGVELVCHMTMHTITKNKSPWVLNCLVQSYDLGHIYNACSSLRVCCLKIGESSTFVAIKHRHNCKVVAHLPCKIKSHQPKKNQIYLKSYSLNFFPKLSITNFIPKCMNPLF